MILNDEHNTFVYLSGNVFSYVVDVLVEIKSTSDCDVEVFYFVGPIYCRVVDL